MEARIRAAALIVRDGRLLLVKHVLPDREYWTPPGGAIEGAESVFDCLRREVREETGLSFRPETIAYVRQVLEPARDWNHVEFFVAGKAGRGEPRVPGGEKVEAEGMRITDARFVSRGEMQGLAVWPARLRDLFWDDLAVKFAETRYLGIEEMRP